MKVLKKSFALILAACIFSVTSGILSVSAGASKVQYYKTVGDIFDADYLIDEQHEEEQRIGSSASIPLGLAGIDTKDKKVGDGSFFQKALTANNGMSAWICGDKKWNGKGYVDASGASRPGFVMWFYISDVNKMAVGTEGAAKDVFFKVRLGSGCRSITVQKRFHLLFYMVYQRKYPDGMELFGCRSEKRLYTRTILHIKCGRCRM